MPTTLEKLNAQTDRLGEDVDAIATSLEAFGKRFDVVEKSYGPPAQPMTLCAVDKGEEEHTPESLAKRNAFLDEVLARLEARERTKAPE